MRRDGVLTEVTAAKQRAVLAALLISPNQAVSLGQLIDVLWPEMPPQAAKVTVQNYIRRLRLALGDNGHSRLVTAEDGYSIVVAGDELDSVRAGTLQRQANQAARGVNQELLHHGAEIALLRDLYRAREDSLRA